ncbi:hypothetical protein ACHQM5_016333 [Ranunculus cassubicifolius]
MQRLKSAGSPLVTDELYALACRPDHRVNRYSGCIVNGIRFHTKDREIKLRTQNSGVVVMGEHQTQEIDFYGVLKDILQLKYVDNKHVFLFKCDWYDVGNKKTGIREDQHFTSVNVSKQWYENDKFALATQASQVFYMSDTKMRGTWQVVEKINARNVYSVSEKEEEIDTMINDDVYQEEQFVVNEIPDKEVTIDKLNRVDVIPDEVDAEIVKENMVGDLVTNVEEEVEGYAEDDDEEVEEFEEEDDTLIEYYSEGEETTDEVVLIDNDSDLEE